VYYPTIAACRDLLFPLIRREMASTEPAPWYEDEHLGLDRLESTLTLMQRDDYEGLLAKAAYLFCSIVDGHFFSNGNKRLGVALLTYFLVVNRAKISAPDLAVMRGELERAFPKLQWEEVQTFRHSHEYFFYHLALIIADRKQKGAITFQQEQKAVRQLLTVVSLMASARHARYRTI
jgi:prophage maintenance system killer protein